MPDLHSFYRRLVDPVRYLFCELVLSFTCCIPLPISCTYMLRTGAVLLVTIVTFDSFQISGTLSILVLLLRMIWNDIL